MRYLSLFSGVGGGDLGLQHFLNWECVGYVEYEPFCQQILRQRIIDGHLSPAPIYGDIRRFISDGYANAYSGMVDCVAGGFPCQDISAANAKGIGIAGERSGLWKSIFRTICIVRPRYILIENSPAIIVRGIETVLIDLAQYFCHEHKRGYFRTSPLAAFNVGNAPHRRIRQWILAYAIGERRRHQGADEHTDIIQNCQARWSIERRRGFGGGIWKTPPTDIYGMDDDVPNRLDRLKAIGNAQVPAVAATAWKLLTEV